MSEVDRAAPGRHLPEELEPHRRELTGYCYRMLGSSFEAEDAVQETMVRAWRNLDGFEGRSSLRSWLYTIATNVCLDMAGSRQRRARPMDLEAPSTAATPLRPPLVEGSWLEPVPDASVLTAGADPAEVAVSRASIRLAFVAALQFLPPRQRAVLLLREVLRWHAEEVADLLDTSVASVNSALQRARATLSERVADDPDDIEWHEPSDRAQQELLARYTAAFSAYDMATLTELVHEDAMQSMPPFEHWLANRDDIFAFWRGPGHECEGSKMVPTSANGMPAFGQYKPGGPDGTFTPWAVQVLRIEQGRIKEFAFFLDTDTLFPLFGLPPALDAAGRGIEALPG